MRSRNRVSPRALARARRRWWPDKNPLRRGWDRAEAAIVAGLAVIFVAGGVLAAVLAGRWAHESGVRAAQVQQSALRQVPAVLLADAPGTTYTGYGTELHPGVRARWTEPGGKVRAGTIPILRDAKAGTTVTVWLDSAGRPAGAPLDRRQVAEQAVLAAVTAPAMLGLLLAGIGSLAYRALDRRRMAAWDADWQITGPRWSSLR